MAAEKLDARMDAMEERVEELQRELRREMEVMRGELQKLPSLQRGISAMMEKLDRVDLLLRRLEQPDRARAVEDDRAVRKRAEGDSSGVSSATREGEEARRPWETGGEGYRVRVRTESVGERESNLCFKPQLRWLEMPFLDGAKPEGWVNRVEPFLGLKQGGSIRDYCQNFELLTAPLKEVSELVNEKNHPKSLDAPQMFDEMELVQPVDVILGFDAWKNTLSDGVDGSPSHDLPVIDKIKCVGVILRRNGALAEFATVRHLLEVLEDRVDEMVPPLDPGDENIDEMVAPVDPGEQLGRLKNNATPDAKSFKSSSEKDGGLRAAGVGHILSHDGEVDHLNGRSQFMFRKGQRMYFQQGTEAEESLSEKCLMSQADDHDRVDATYRSASLLSTVFAKKPMSLLAVGQWGDTYLLHGALKLKYSRELRTMLARSDDSEGHRLRFKKLDTYILSRENVASVLIAVCEECEELLIEAGRNAQLIADMGLEAAFDAGKVYLAAIDKFDAMDSRDTVYAPDALFRRGRILQPRSHLQAHNSKEKMKLQIDESSLSKEEASLCINKVWMGHGLLNATSGFRNKCFGDNDGFIDCWAAVQVHSAGKLHDSWDDYNEDLLRGILERNDVFGDVLFAGYVQNGMQDRAFSLFRNMIYTNVRPNGFTLTSPLSGCSVPCYVKIGDSFQGYAIRVGLGAKTLICNSMITGTSEHGNAGNVHLVFDAMPGCDVFSWTAMVVAYTFNGNWCEARHIFVSTPEDNWTSWNTRRVVCLLNGKYIVDERPHKFSDHFIFVAYTLTLFCAKELSYDKPDYVSYNYALSTCAGKGALKLTRPINCKGIKSGFESGIGVKNARITAWGQCGCHWEAVKIFKCLSTPAKISWNTMLTGYSHNGRGNESLDFYEIMRKSGVEPNHVTFISLLSVCSYIEGVKKGQGFLNWMVNTRGIRPTMYHYASVVDLLGCAGLLFATAAMIRNRKIESDAAVWGALMGLGRLHWVTVSIGVCSAF
ncbi:hypothetical protein J5N97_026349 [Dioscorea zingiberensis]|uniref:Pentatricopeptide repeat-containing protein n=1 Tax=Dioscorea zingiberensis TaxID=325984 RepID=A0A9D5C1Z2_9LILI|nr:hypothetical protein J5N97_026349 [Dioscorea zingiberensis]